MSSRRKGKAWLLSASAAMLITTVACSSNDGPNAATSTAAPSSGASAVAPEGTKDTQAEINLKAYPEPVTVTIGATVGAGINYPEGESVDDNIHTRLNKEMLNIEYKNKFVVEASKLSEKINLAIASDDLPDVLLVGTEQMQKMVKNDQLADLSQVYDQYASAELKRNLEYQNKVSFVPAETDGKLYGIPAPKDYGNSIPVMYVRQDWLDALGLEPPKTMDELTAVAKAFVEKDPDKNGQKDTFAISLESGMNTLAMDAIASAFGAYPSIMVKDASGRIVYGSTQPEMKEALKKMQELYKLGAFDPEFGIKDYAVTVEKIMAGKVGILFGAFWNPLYPLKQNLENDPNAKWNAYPIPTLDGGTPVPKALPFTNEWIVVRKAFAHPEAIVKSMNLWTDMFISSKPELFPEAQKRWYEAIGSTHKGLEAHNYARPFFFDSPFGNLEVGRELREYHASNDESKLVSAKAKDVFTNQIKPGGLQAWAMEKMYYEAEAVLDGYKELVYPAYVGASTPTMLSKGPTLGKLESETFVNIIMGASLDTFDAFVEKYHKLGGDDILKEINAQK
ncbi:extracellular solute-binding protein [Cohnella rhizosphaerae]|uniref:Extracellular solute-binding protein n=1 Tax=Cohnella rhizosphaerae TaxID=1457232 RepID=A0A9X4KYQ0_9BACL|nr:extracellular solute-binding protein [Cohnella rhizosphaerae]MDG0813786.1 extracellular solute-binding protein [Cohnella rhizosphaerae]